MENKSDVQYTETIYIDKTGNWSVAFYVKCAARERGFQRGEKERAARRTNASERATRRAKEARGPRWREGEREREKERETMTHTAVAG